MNFDMQQSIANYIEFPKKEKPLLRYAPDGGTERLAFHCKDLWFISIPHEFKDWISLSEEEGQAGSFMVKIETRPYQGQTFRKGFVTLNCWDEQVRIPLIQYPPFVPIADPCFKQYLIDHFDNDQDGELTYEEACQITELSLDDPNIETLQGMEYLVNLTSLKFEVPLEKLTSLDVSQNTALQELDCSGKFLHQCPITQLDVSQNKALTKLNCSYCRITHLDVSHNKALTSLNCDFNQLTCLDITQNKELTSLICDSNQLSNLDVTQNKELTKLVCYKNQLTSLDLTQNKELTWLSCGSNQLTSLDVTQNKELTGLECASNRLTSLDLTQNKELIHLDCSSNKLTSLDITQNKALTALECGSNQLTSLDITQNKELKELWCWSNQLTSLDLSQNKSIKTLNIRMKGLLKTLYVFPHFEWDQLLEWCHSKDDCTQIIKRKES